jgi:hypothetical protein
VSARALIDPIERPELHRRVALGEQLLGELGRAMDAVVIVFQRSGLAEVAVAGPALSIGRA